MLTKENLFELDGKEFFFAFFLSPNATFVVIVFLKISIFRKEIFYLKILAFLRNLQEI